MPFRMPMNTPKLMRAGLALLLLSQLTACGLKGPLYLPPEAEQVPPAGQPGEAAPAPATE